MRITFDGINEEWERRFLEESLADQTSTFPAVPLRVDATDQANDPEILSVFIDCPVDEGILGRLPALRFISVRATGYDHIDLEACSARDIIVSNVPRYGENTVAEHTFGLILNLSRKIHQAYNRTRSYDFSLHGLEGFDLRDKTLGVIGAGHIGLHVIRVARAFGMPVLVYDPQPQPLVAEVLGFTYLRWEDVLGDSDVVTLHVPLTPETRHFMNRERFARMKRGALLINTARGTVIDTEALLWALDEGIVAGAGLDVIEGEELLSEERHFFRVPPSEFQLHELLRDHPLFGRDNVIVTPHMAWYSRDARRRILETTVSNIRAFLRGTPENVVSAPATQPPAG